MKLNCTQSFLRKSKQRIIAMHLAINARVVLGGKCLNPINSTKVKYVTDVINLRLSDKIVTHDKNAFMPKYCSL